MLRPQRLAGAEARGHGVLGDVLGPIGRRHQEENENSTPERPPSSPASGRQPRLRPPSPSSKCRRASRPMASLSRPMSPVSIAASAEARRRASLILRSHAASRRPLVVPSASADLIVAGASPRPSGRRRRPRRSCPSPASRGASGRSGQGRLGRPSRCWARSRGPGAGNASCWRSTSMTLSAPAGTTPCAGFPFACGSPTPAWPGIAPHLAGAQPLLSAGRGGHFHIRAPLGASLPAGRRKEPPGRLRLALRVRLSSVPLSFLQDARPDPERTDPRRNTQNRPEARVNGARRKPVPREPG